MKTLILYATKYGATATLARRIANHIEGSVIHDLKEGCLPSLDGFDRVVIGSSIYAGMIRKEAKTYITQNTEALCKKKLGLFISGMDASSEKQFFDANFPAEVLQAAAAASVLGGIFDPKKAGFLERFIMKMVSKQSGYMSTIDDDKIRQFAESIK